MIFDMTRRVSGGGGPSSSDAILTVTVPTGSAVTMTKSGVTITPTIWVQAADSTLDCALFVIPPSLFDSQADWTVTATLGTDSATGTITIDDKLQYQMELAYSLYIFVAGRGALVQLTTDHQSNANVTVGTNEIAMTYSGTSYVRALWFTTNAIDFSDYAYAQFEAVITNVRSSPVVFISSAVPTVTSVTPIKQQVLAIGTTVYTIDLSDVNESGYLGASGSVNGSFSNVTLFKS